MLRKKALAKPLYMLKSAGRLSERLEQSGRFFHAKKYLEKGEKTS
jgi:hypothetical protein